MRVKCLTELMQLAGNPAARDRVYDLSLRSSHTDDRFIKVAASFPNLRSLDASHGQVTDKGVEYLRDIRTSNPSTWVGRGSGVSSPL